MPRKPRSPAGAGSVARLRAQAATAEPPFPGDDIGGGSGPGDGGDAELIGLLDPKDPLAIARTFIELRFKRGPWLTLLLWRGDWYRWQPTGWRRIDELELRGLAYFWLEGCRKRDRNGQAARFCPNARFINNLLDPLRNLVRLPDDFAGGWVTTDDPDAAASIADAPAAAEILPVPNGLLHLPDMLLLAPTPAFFAPVTCPIPYDDKAPAPKVLLAKLQEFWPDDKEARGTLQEIFGYVLGPETDLHKIVFIVGPPRSGKSTLIEILRRLIGVENCCAPTLSSLGTRFGKEQLIGKKLGVIPDARLGRYADAGEIVQTVLAISGEDAQTVERKNRSEWNGTLGTKFVLVSNELPALGDASGAFASRLVLLQMTRSFLGGEDTHLRARLLEELPGILLWALEGWRRLRKRGRFQQPKSGDDALRALRELSSDIQIFIEERCEIGPDFRVSTADLLAAYNQFRTDLGQEHVSNAQFGKRLRAACPSVKRSQPRDDGSRLPHYAGIHLKLTMN